MERLLNARDILIYCNGDKTPTPSTPSEVCDDDDPIETINICNSTEKITKKCRPDSFEDIDKLCKEVWPALAVMGGIDRGGEDEINFIDIIFGITYTGLYVQYLQKSIQVYTLFNFV